MNYHVIIVVDCSGIGQNRFDLADRIRYGMFV